MSKENNKGKVPLPKRSQRTIRQQLIWTNITIGLLILLAGGIVTWQVNRLAGAVTALQVARERAAAALEVRQDSTQLIATINRLLPVEDATTFESDVSAALEELQASYANLTMYTVEAEQDEILYPLLDLVDRRIDSVIGIGETMVRQAHAGQWPSVRVRVGVLVRDQQQLANDTSRLVELTREVEAAANMQAASARRGAILYPALVVTLTLALTALLAWRTTYNITRPISSLTEAATAITEGDLKRTVVIEAGNEIDLLALAFNTMTRRLRDLIDTLEDRVQERTQALRESEEKFRNLAEKSPNMIFINRRRNIVYINEMCEEVMGYTQEEFYAPDFDFLNLIAPESVETVKENYRRHMQGQEIPPSEYQLLTKDGRRLDAIHTTRLITYEGEPAILGIVTDITERKQAEEALRDSKEQFRALSEAAFEAIFLSEKGICVGQNLAAEKMFGYTLSEAIGRPGIEWIAPEEREMVMNNMLSGYEETYEATALRKDGTTFPAELRGKMMRYQGRQVRVTALRDITRRVQAEEALRESNRYLEDTLANLMATQVQLVQQERLAAVGQLAAGIAHDFNNILTTILGYTELLQQSPDMPEPVQADLARIISSGQRAANLVRQLLDFSRKSIRQTQQLDLVPFIKETIEFLDYTIPENIHFHLKIAPAAHLIEADPTQIHQLLTNLAVNARDAMPDGGELRITVSRREMEGKEYCTACNQAIEGEWVCVEVADTGTGIPLEVLSHIFEPFFTTREVGEGAGLGLAQVYGIVNQHGGHITVNSQVGQGTIFTIYLPPATPGQHSPKPKETTPISLGQGETILLVEDEPTVLETTRAMLIHLGYQIVTATNGREALAIYAARKGEIALVLSDMVMPDMAGLALFNTLKAQNPELKLVMMSGYPLEEKGATLLEQGVVDWFQKPTSLPHLAQIINQALS